MKIEMNKKINGIEMNLIPNIDQIKKDAKIGSENIYENSEGVFLELWIKSNKCDCCNNFDMENLHFLIDYKYRNKMLQKIEMLNKKYNYPKDLFMVNFIEIDEYGEQELIRTINLWERNKNGTKKISRDGNFTFNNNLYNTGYNWSNFISGCYNTTN